MKPKISAVSPRNNRWRPYWSSPLIKKIPQKTPYFSAFVYQTLFSSINEDLLSTLSISAIQNTQIIMLGVNSVGTNSACDLASIFACPQCEMHHLVYLRYLCTCYVHAISRCRAYVFGQLIEHKYEASFHGDRLAP